MRGKIIILFSALAVSACGKSFEASQWPEKVNVADEVMNKTLSNATHDLDTPAEGALPAPEDLTGRSYLVKNERQKFTLKNLGHLVWAEFNCDTQFETPRPGPQGKIRIVFHPELQIQWTNSKNEKMTLASAAQLCDQKSELGSKKFSAIGTITKDVEKNVYKLTYSLNSPDIVTLNMSWSAVAPGKGLIQCRTRSGEVLEKGTLSSCVLNAKKLN